MRSINGFLASDTPSGLESAKNIFSKGAFSDAFANLQIVDQDEHLLISQPRNYNNRTTRFEDQSNKLLLAPAQERPIKFANRASPANFATQ